MSAEHGTLLARQRFRSGSIQAVFKRAFDFTLACFGLVLLSPLFGVIILLVRASSAGRAFYKQGRVGTGGDTFQIIKFRTMREGADQESPLDTVAEPSSRISWKTYQKLLDDPRLTKIGRILRKTSLDELPQLVNVVKGEMSLVGPRPILPDQIDYYGPSFEDYLEMRPGMTGLWQVSGRNRLSFEERVRIDRDYFKNWSLSLDFRILAKTLAVVLRGDGAY